MPIWYLLLPPTIAKSGEIPTKFDLTASSRSSKVIDLGVNRKPMYDFLLVPNSNFGRLCYRFRDIEQL